uniref:Uncharacterized protein n=1 Tax=Salvator merianae TaxID=96440 RepID=A0A8D0E9Q1_SALMN
FEAVRPQMSHPLEQYKPEEDLQNGKAKFEKSAIADKVQGESEEIWLLKQQIAGLQDEFRRNETHWHAAHGELKNQVETLTKQNLELQEELRISELQRIDVERQHGMSDFAGRKPETPHNIFEYLSIYSLLESEQLTKSQKSVMSDQRRTSPSKSLHSRSSTPTGWRTPNPVPPELQKVMFVL